jgi:anti-sigma regulatory factor (Ser/Thr protein kinase)
VNAGHPPPLVFGPSGDAEFLESEGGVPLGAVTRARYVESVASLQPGSTLVLYTDGLIEDRDTLLDDGMERLRESALEARDGLEEMCDHILERSLASRSGEDDVAILALRLVPLGDRLDLTLPRDPTVLAPLRSTVRRWLAAGGASEQEVYEIVVAIGEACANAVQHAVGPAPSRFDVRGWLDGEVKIAIRDHGRWRAPRNTGGGRGLSIMRSFMDDVDVRTGDDGTEVTMRRRLRAREPEGAGR